MNELEITPESPEIESILENILPLDLTKYMDPTIYNAITATISQGHFELYKYMKLQHSQGLSIENWKIEEIYNNFVRKPFKRVMYASHINKIEMNNKANANRWFMMSFGVLIKKGYFKLRFSRQVE